jgi:hypothetical protein
LRYLDTCACLVYPRLVHEFYGHLEVVQVDNNGIILQTTVQGHTIQIDPQSTSSIIGVPMLPISAFPFTEIFEPPCLEQLRDFFGAHPQGDERAHAHIKTGAFSPPHRLLVKIVWHNLWLTTRRSELVLKTARFLYALWWRSRHRFEGSRSSTNWAGYESTSKEVQWCAQRTHPRVMGSSKFVESHWAWSTWATKNCHLDSSSRRIRSKLRIGKKTIAGNLNQIDAGYIDGGLTWKYVGPQRLMVNWHGNMKRTIFRTISCLIQVRYLSIFWFDISKFSIMGLLPK